jgi:peptidoglycan/xylan/chitin deacetylase (PgdA/CDA1 family)
MLPVLEELGLPATVYVTTWYAERALPVLNVAIDYIHRRAGRPAAETQVASERLVGLPVGDRAQAIRDHSLEHGVPLDWWSHRQFHLMTPEEVADAPRRGLDIQLHTHRHTSNIPTLDEELTDNKARLMAWSGLPTEHFRHFCYPSGRYHDGIEPILKAHGVRSATLVEQGTNRAPIDRFRLRRFLDGRSVTDIEFDSYLAGLLDSFDLVTGRLKAALR